MERITKNGRGRERRRIPGRLHHLRDRLRSRYRVDATAGYDIIGKDGATLSDYWARRHEDAARLLEPRLPQLVLIGLVAERSLREHDLDVRRSGPAHRLHHQAGEGPRRALRRTRRQRRKRPGWPRSARLAINAAAFFDACTPGYYNNEGHLVQRGGGLNGETYSPGINAFNALLAKWREGGQLDGLELG